MKLLKHRYQGRFCDVGYQITTKQKHSKKELIFKQLQYKVVMNYLFTYWIHK